MLIIICLLPLIFLAFLSVLFGGDFIGYIIDESISGTATTNITDTTVIDWATKEVEFNIDPITGMISVLIAIAVFTILIGIQILASGLSDVSVKAMMVGVIYTGLWGVLSVLSIEVIKSIELIGSLIYVLLTVGYAIGVFEKMSGGN